MKKIKDTEVRWGILGVGNVCEVKSAPAMKIIPNSKLVAVMRRDEEKVIDYAKRHGVSKWYTDAQQLIDDPEVNAIYIATPPNAHLELTNLAAVAGKPVYVEKPMARTFEECQKMIQTCEESGVPLYVAYYRRTLPHFLRIKELMDQGVLGEIRSVHINLKQPLKPTIVANLENNWRINPEIAGGGYFFDLASHQLDLLDFFFGKITQASGFCSNQGNAYEAEDIVVGSFVFESGVMGTGNWCFTSSENSEIDEVVIYGSKGVIRFETFGKGEFSFEVDGKNKELFQFDLPKHIQEPLIKSIVEDLLGTGICPSTGESGARTNCVMEELTKKRIDKV
ncbi:Gfo/Idh/MocA family oxidoreductase [Algoriphagus sp. SE2]|uniref:Gfo/Idh/MocA family protein n=1 Tax=Algoriphagus sp. SE2 TaxID=3141536 RepID=UPI0031CCDD9F